MKKTSVILTLIVILAFFVGLGNPLFDHPLAFSVADEFEGPRVALNILETRSLIQKSYLPPFWAWVQVPVMAISILTLKLVGTFPSLDSIRDTVILNGGFMLPAARLASALISTLSIIWVYKIARKVISLRFALLVSFLFSLSYFRVEMAHFARVNSLFMFFSLGCLYFSLDFWKKFSPKNWYFCLFLAVLASLTYLVGFFLFPFLAAILFLSKNIRQVLNIKIFIYSLAITSLVGLIFLNPTILTGNLRHLSILAKSYSIATNIFVQASTLVWSELPLFVLGLIGIVPFYKRFPKFTLTLALFSLFPSLLYLVIIDSGMPRYSMMLVFLPLFSAAFMFYESIFFRKILFVITVLAMFIVVSKFNWLTFQNSTFLQTRNWIYNNIPVDKVILISGDYLGIVPSLKAQKFMAKTQPSSHLAQAKLMEIKPQTRSQSRNVYYIDPSKADFPYDYLVFLGSPSINTHSLTPVYSLTPGINPEFTNSPTDVARPILDLFSASRFGPKIEIYRPEKTE